ncbi:MAG: hypothetical protein IKM59_00970 [Oscillospiraceae bacterium]|nr:hypothetical protein [Oscillospiraceae bacterium]
MKHQNLRKLLQCGFLTVLALLLLGSLLKTYLLPKEVNFYENRKANQPPNLSLSGFLDASFQNSLEKSLEDQVLGAQTMEKAYNNVESDLSFSVLERIYATHPDRYFRYNQIRVFNSDYLLYEPRPLTEASKAAFDRSLRSIASLAQTHRDLDFHVYYIEKDTDRNFETGSSCGNYEYLEEKSAGAPYSLSRFSVESFEDFSQYFYKTDHHWNHVGSYRAYLQLCEELGLSSPLEKGEPFPVAPHLDGSKLALAIRTEAWSEPMEAYFFDFPPMDIRINGELQKDYGHQNENADAVYAVGATMTYSHYYGNDVGEVILTSERTEGDNLLILGESYDNAILKLLSTHFQKTCSVDLRYYEHYMGKPFDFSSYVREHEIDRVLFIGNIDFFLMDEFYLGG